MATCAVAEAWQRNEEGGEIVSQSVGSWSRTYAPAVNRKKVPCWRQLASISAPRAYEDGGMDMSMFPDAVTLYNKYVEENAEKWKRTVLTGVYWNDIEGAVLRKTGAVSSSNATIIIPCPLGAIKSRRNGGNTAPAGRFSPATISAAARSISRLPIAPQRSSPASTTCGASCRRTASCLAVAWTIWR